jgi:hypothetical protein
MAQFSTLKASDDCWRCSMPGAEIGPFHIVMNQAWGSGQQSIWLCRWMRLHVKCLEEMRLGGFDGEIRDEPQCDMCTLAASKRLAA